MTTALELLTAVRGERGLLSHWGKWAIYISKKIDAIISGGAGAGVGTIDFVQRTYRTSGNLVVSSAGSGTGAFQGQPLIVTTTQANEKVVLTFTADRQNANAVGSGRYQFNIDSAKVGFLKESVGNVRETISMTDMLVIANPGVHFIDVDVVAITGDETMFDFAILVGVGYKGV